MKKTKNEALIGFKVAVELENDTGEKFMTRTTDFKLYGNERIRMTKVILYQQVPNLDNNSMDYTIIGEFKINKKNILYEMDK